MFGFYFQIFEMAMMESHPFILLLFEFDPKDK